MCALIEWCSKRQRRVALSTAEAEFRAVTIASKDILWLRNLLQEIGRRAQRPTLIYEDNEACIKMIENPVVSGKNKFVELDMHFIRDHWASEHIRMKKISTREQRADILTKNLGTADFQKHRDTLLKTDRSYI